MTFIDLATKTQTQLKKILPRVLKSRGYKPKIKKGFIYAQGILPIMLVAHLDTVHAQLIKQIVYSQHGNIISSPQGIGGDDRAGIYIILELVKRFKCHVLFCEDEEIGGVGAELFVKSAIQPNVNFIIEYDRKGLNDAVFYNCNNRQFVDFITSFGFNEKCGSFSDISIIAPALGIAAVNLSAGFYNQHTPQEYVDMTHIWQIISKSEHILMAKSPKFEYMSHIRRYNEYNEALLLMPLFDGYYIIADGIFHECDGDYMVDEHGRVYEYDWDYDEPIITDFHAYSENGNPVRFNHKNAYLFKKTLDNLQ